MAKNKKTFDDMNEDPKFLTIQKKCLETQIQKVMEWDLDELFKNYWKGCPKKLKEYIYSYDSSDDYSSGVFKAFEEEMKKLEKRFRKEKN